MMKSKADNAKSKYIKPLSRYFSALNDDPSNDVKDG